MHPSTISYDAGTSIRKLLRKAPESIGAKPPLIHGPIVMADVWMRYVNAMTVAWKDTMHSRLPVNEWLAKAEKLRSEYESQEPQTVAEDAGSDDEAEWCGITCVSSPKDSLGMLSC